MGISSKKSKSTQTTNQQTSLTTTPTNPDFVVQPIQSLTTRISDYFKGVNPSDLVAGPDPLQTQAGQGAAGLTTNPLYGEVGGAGAQTVSAASGLANSDGYLNKYIENVVKASLAGFDQNANLTRQQQQLDLGGDATFGGSGGAITKALTEGQLGLSRGQLESGLRYDAQDRAFGLGQQDADRQQQASIANAQLAEAALARKLDAANAQGSDARANIATQAGIGDVLRAIAQAKQLAPVTALGSEATLLGSLPFDLFRGTQANGTLNGTVNTTAKESGASLGDWLSAISGIARAAATAGAGG